MTITPAQTEIITRKFQKVRGDRIMIYEFQTLNLVFCSDGKPLFKYLASLIVNGREEKELGCSDAPAIISEIKEVQSSVIELAKAADYEGRNSYQHKWVQDYFLLHDPYTVATEVPVWNNERSGFIDLIRVKDGSVQIWDFKPNAHKENKDQVGAQLYQYKELLIARTGLDRQSVTIGYFDNAHAYLVS